jgi:hypothetical protein
MLFFITFRTSGGAFSAVAAFVAFIFSCRLMMVF